jgi:hypothetical protein
LIRLSLLPTSHPTGFQPRRVRPSTQYNPRFSLLMGSSRSFGSTIRDIVALFRLGFPVASVRKTLTGPRTVTRRIIMQKARRHTINRAPTACRHMVSGSLYSPRRGSSHLSIALLSLLSVVREYLALRDGPRRFSRDSTWPSLLRYPSRGRLSFAYGTVTLYGPAFLHGSAKQRLCNSHVKGPTTPCGKTLTV